GDRGGSGGIVGGVAGDRPQGMGARDGGRRVPTDRVRSRGVFRAQSRPIELELDADDGDIVRRVGGDCDRGRDRRAGRRRRHGPRCRHGAVPVYGDRGGGGGIVGGVAGDRSQGMGARGGGGGVPSDRIRGRRVFRAQGRSIELDLDADHTHVVRSVGGNRDGAGDRRARSRRGHAHRRRRRVGYGDGHRSGAGGVGRITGDRSQDVGARGGGSGG